MGDKQKEPETVQTTFINPEGGLIVPRPTTEGRADGHTAESHYVDVEDAHSDLGYPPRRRLVNPRR